MTKERDAIWQRIGGPWDILVVGGGVTGAGLLREAAHLGLRALLVERRDFAWGASSRSSKLVHGGLRYLAQGDLRLTRESVRARNRLLRVGAGLITPLGFLLPVYRGERPGRRMYGAALAVYDALGAQWTHRYRDGSDFSLLAPAVAQTRLRGGFAYQDAQTDDARLVLRLLREAETAGGCAINYVAAESLLHESDGRVTGVRLKDTEDGRTSEARATVVVNATGAWADHLRGQAGGAMRLRPLRGSHLVFPAWRFPLAQAVGFTHPADHRPVFALPWEGVTLVGTTDVDHTRPLDDEPAIAPEEVAYLMEALDARFPALELTTADAIATFAGLRPVIGSEKADPSHESRDAALWDDDGLLTVTGGKLTTFRESAIMALSAIRERIPGMALPAPDAAPLDAVEPLAEGAAELSPEQRQRLAGRYGADASALVAAAHPGELAAIPDTPILWAELRWAARMERVRHLDDLLLRRVRLGLLLPEGGAAHLPAIRAICQPELGWDDARWQEEEARYRTLWQASYRVPEEALRNVRPMIERVAESAEPATHRSRWPLAVALVAAGMAVISVAAILVARQSRRQSEV
ncbi:MAG TPA: glycerol-3-phosphate dehydrogenase/oxidase [Ktedonobacterales bacterium]|nr:glycerol-3-phosphate dehydrogenase/oxidase [Ktedonobacterales bacterium]